MPPASVAFLAFPSLTLLDLIGPYDALRRIKTMGVDPHFSWKIIGTHPDLRDDSGLPLATDGVRLPLDGFDLLVIPGGFGVDTLRGDPEVLDYLRSWGTERPVATVCSGSLLLGELGWLRGVWATTHHSRKPQLSALGALVGDERVIDQGRIVTAGGVTCGLDLGLHLVGRFWGDAARVRIARQMEFPGG